MRDWYTTCKQKNILEHTIMSTVQLKIIHSYLFCLAYQLSSFLILDLSQEQKTTLIKLQFKQLKMNICQTRDASIHALHCYFSELLIRLEKSYDIVMSIHLMMSNDNKLVNWLITSYKNTLFINIVINTLYPFSFQCSLYLAYYLKTIFQTLL